MQCISHIVCLLSVLVQILPYLFIVDLLSHTCYCLKIKYYTNLNMYHSHFLLFFSELNVIVDVYTHTPKKSHFNIKMCLKNQNSLLIL